MFLKLFREFVAIIIRFSGLPFIVRHTIARTKVTILIYHSPQADTLYKHLKYLTKRYTFIDLDTYINALYSNCTQDLPKKSMIITLDDGHCSNYKLLGIFKKYNIRPTIYLCTQLVNTNRRYWFSEFKKDQKLLKKLPNKERLSILKKKYNYTPKKNFQNREVLNIDEINEMKNYVDFQSHSRFHPILPFCDNQECLEEIELSKKEMVGISGEASQHFAYPNGNYTEREINFLKQAGYLSSRTIDVGWNDKNTNPFMLKVMGITDDASINIMVVQLTGIIMYVNYFIRGSFNGTQPAPKAVWEFMDFNIWVGKLKSV